MRQVLLVAMSELDEEAPIGVKHQDVNRAVYEAPAVYLAPREPLDEAPVRVDVGDQLFTHALHSCSLFKR